VPPNGKRRIDQIKAEAAALWQRGVHPGPPDQDSRRAKRVAAISERLFGR
jgi:hypothetical protein